MRLTDSEYKEALSIHVMLGKFSRISQSPFSAKGVNVGEASVSRILSSAIELLVVSTLHRLLIRKTAVICVASSAQSKNSSQHDGKLTAAGWIFPPSQRSANSKRDEPDGLYDGRDDEEDFPSISSCRAAGPGCD